MKTITKSLTNAGIPEGQTHALHASNGTALPRHCSDKTSSEKMKILKANPGTRKRVGYTILMALALSVFLCITPKAKAQYCTSALPGMNQYSRVIHPNAGTSFTTNEWLQADFDSSNANVYIPSTSVMAGSNSVFWANVHTNGVINSISGVTINGTENTYAVKRDYHTGDIITAGNIVIVQLGVPYTVLFVMRQTSGGTVSWCNYYFQANTPVTNHVVVTVAKNQDIVVASSTLTGNDDIIIVRMTAVGAMEYYEDRNVTNLGNTTESFPTINGITATTDNGFVLAGSSGYGPTLDYVQAMAMMFDQGYSGGSSSTLNWSYTYRSFRSTYDLTMSGDRSSSYANGVIEDPAHLFHIVGYTTDADQFGASATYENGFIFTLDSTGRRITGTSAIPTFQGATGDFVRFNSVCTDPGSANSYITGWVKSGSNGSYKTLIAEFPSGYGSTIFSQVYGSGSSGAIDKGFLVYPQIAGVVAAGISNEYTSSNTEPYELAVDINGNSQSYFGCSSSYMLTFLADENDSVPLSSTVQTQSTATSITTIVNGICENMEDICGGCPDETPSGQTYYSATLDNYNYIVAPQTTYETMQADQDASRNIITANHVYANGREEIVLTSTAPNGQTNFSKDFWINQTGPYSNGDDAKAVKVAANGDIIVAGLMDLNSGSSVIFLMRISSTGSLIWQNYYKQTSIDLIGGNIVVTETSDGNIVAVASPTPFYPGGPDDIDILRVSSTGNIQYHEVYSIRVKPPQAHYFNFTQLRAYIRGIAATGTGGYAICGTTGYGNTTDTDFYGALIIHFDRGTSSPTSPTKDWDYVISKPPASYPPYSLLFPIGYHSVNSANAIVYDGTNIIVAGTFDNSDTGRSGATFRNGFLLGLTNPGSGNPTQNFIKEIDPPSGLMDLYGLVINGSGDYILTGSDYDGSALYTVALDINPSTWTLSAGKTYGDGATDYGCSVFNNSTYGYFIVGFTYDNTINNSYPFLQVNLRSVETSLVLGSCSADYLPSIVTDPGFDVFNNTNVEYSSTGYSNIQSVSVTKYDLCGGVFDVCGSGTGPVSSPEVRNNNLRSTDTEAGSNTLNVYPNPAGSNLTVQVSAQVPSAGIIKIIDMEGREVSCSDVNINDGNNQYELNISGIKPGMYFIKIVSANGVAYPVTKISKY